jgi:hypothetical protein
MGAGSSKQTDNLSQQLSVLQKENSELKNLDCVKEYFKKKEPIFGRDYSDTPGGYENRGGVRRKKKSKNRTKRKRTR